MPQHTAPAATFNRSAHPPSRFPETLRERGEPFELGHLVEEPRLAVLELEDDRLGGVAQSVVLFPIRESVEIRAPVEAVQEAGFLVEVEFHRRIDAAADLETKAGFALVGAIGDDFDVRLFIDEQVERPGADVVLGGFGAAFLLVDPPLVRLGEDRLAGGALFPFGRLRRAAEVEDLFDAEDFEELVLTANGGERLFDERLGISGLREGGGGNEEEKDEAEHGGGHETRRAPMFFPFPSPAAA